MDLENSWALVTGGSSGVGKATAQRLAALGASVVIVDIDERGKKVSDDIKGTFFQVDITQSDPLELVFEELSRRSSPFKVAVNCAGIAPPSRMTGREGAKPLSFFQNVINVNLVGTYNVMRLSAQLMAQQSADLNQQRGVIINTASIAAYDGQIGQTAYSASKAGVVGMTLPAARELAQFGIRVMTIAPGLLDTPMLHGLPDEVRASLEKNIPFPKRFARVEEFSSLVEHIVSNTMLNGEVIRLDGALRMPPS